MSPPADGLDVLFQNTSRMCSAEDTLRLRLRRKRRNLIVCQINVQCHLGEAPCVLFPA